MNSPSDRPVRPNKQEEAGSRIVFNGVEYDNIDEMPTYARNLYEQSLRTAEARHREPGRKPDPSGRSDAEPAFSPAAIIGLLALVVLAVFAYYLLK